MVGNTNSHKLGQKSPSPTVSSISANLCSINICGLSERSRFCLDTYCYDKNLDVLAVQESGRHSSGAIKLTNMNLMLDTNSSKNNGCALFINKKHSFKQLNITPHSNQFDYIWALVVIYGKRYIIGTAYVKSDSEELVTGMMKMVNQITEKELSKYNAKGVILMGDFNARHFTWGDNMINKNGKRLAVELDPMKLYIHAPATPTFLCINGNSLIDLFISSVNLADSLSRCWTDESAILYSGAPIRGHIPIHTALMIHDVNTKTAVVEKINLKDVNWDKWHDDLENALNISTNAALSQENDPVLVWEEIHRCIDTVTRNNSTKKKVCKHSKPYWTKELSTLATQYHKAQRCWNKRNTDQNKTNLEMAKDAFDSKRKEECRNFVLQNTKDLNTAETREFWKKFKRLFGKDRDNRTEVLVNSDEKIITEEQDKESFMFSTFFEGSHLKKEEFDKAFYDSISETYATAKSKGFPGHCDTLLHDAETHGDQSTSHVLYNEPIGEDEIRFVLNNKKSNGKSFDMEEIHPMMLKCMGPNTIRALAKLYNLCLSQGVWVWDTADVIFLKKEDKKSYNDAGAYRPISITSYIGKILEKILVLRLEAYLYGEGIVDSSQEGFTKGRNTVRYLNRLVFNVKKRLEKKLTVACLFLDFEKAFDSVWKKGLIVKLHNAGVNGKFLALIDSFLSCRKVRLHVNDYVGAIRSCLEVGLPQGSVLSPILFKFYVMDLGADLAKTGKVGVYKFADDGTFKVYGADWRSCKLCMEKVIDSLDKWCKMWRLIMNCKIDKTEIVVFTDNKNTCCIPTELCVNNKRIRIVKQSKVLGLIIDNQLCFKQHSDMVLSSLNSKWVMICKYSNRNWGFNQKVIVRLIKTIFLSKLFYAGHVWINSSNINEIEQLWYKMIKAAVGAVFNIKKSLAEVILGLPPLLLVNDVYRVKHYLKLNIAKTVGDQLRIDLSEDEDVSTALRNDLKMVFKFLSWKQSLQPKLFTEKDKNIILSRDHDQFTNLSATACSYSKSLIKIFTESLWQKKICTEYQCEGYSNIPVVSCNSLPTPANTNREVETILMSHFYENNLLNGFLYRIGNKDAVTPLCGCKRDIQTPFHSLIECKLVNNHIQSNLVKEMKAFFRSDDKEDTCIVKDSITLLNMSRDKTILNLMGQAIKCNLSSYRTKIVLNPNLKQQ